MKKTKKIMEVLLFCALVCAPLVLFATLMSTHAKEEIEAREKRENPPKPKYRLLPYEIAKPIEEIDIDLRVDLKEQYKISPPLRPDRFRRRIKMLYGIEINDYPNNVDISLSGMFGYLDYLSKKYQLITDGSSHNNTEIYRATEKDEPEDRDMPMPTYADSIYSIYRRYLYMNNPKDLHYLHEYCYNIYQQTGKANPYMDDINVFRVAYKPYLAYKSALFNISADLVKDVDQMSGKEPAYLLCNQTFTNDFIRYTDVRLDAVSNYLKEQKKLGRTIFLGTRSSASLKPHMANDIVLVEWEDGYKNLYSIISSIYNWDDWESYFWANYKPSKGVAAFLSFILQLEDKALNKEVLDFMKFDNNEDEQDNRIKKDIRENNYYGYTLLREFDNNPMREMPTLAKIGTSFQGHVKQANTLLLLEPFKNSYDIDTLQTYETFTAYEMGHDDYYFVEVEKPVESPIAGTDGYAKIVDRTEKVHGYIEKSKVVSYTDAQLLTHPKFTDHTSSKKGVINDKDGYVNVRAERNVKSEVVDKLIGIEFVEYWQLMGNWYIVETRNGKRGFVYKDRIKEKL